MKASDLKAAGYRVGTLISDDDVTRMQQAVDACYISKVWPNFSATDTDVKAAEMALIFIALTVANVYATRAGGKLKLSPNLSERGFASQADYENADRLLRVLQGKQGAVQGRLDGIVDDGLHIYMRSYLSMN